MEKQAREVTTKDMWTAIYLKLRGHVPTEIERTVINERNVVLYHYEDSAWEDHDAYTRGVVLPIDDIHDVKTAYNFVKGNLHLYK